LILIKPGDDLILKNFRQDPLPESSDQAAGSLIDQTFKGFMPFNTLMAECPENHEIHGHWTFS